MSAHLSDRLPTRRRFLAAAAAAGLLPAATALLGTPTASTAGAALADDLPDYAPVPAEAVGPQPNAQGYVVGQIAGNLYWVTDGAYQAMFLSTREGVVLVDAPPSLGQNLLRAIDEVTQANGQPKQVTHVVYSHAHADHIGAAGVLGPDVERIGHRETDRLLRRAADPNRPAPTETFARSYVLRVGGERLELAYHGPNHAPGNIFIYAPAQQTLMLVDVIFPGWVPFKGLAVSQDIPGWVRAQEAAMDYPWQTLVGGHLGRLGTRTDGELQRQYMADLDASARAALANLDPTPFFQKYGPSGNLWAVFKAYLDAASKQTADPVVAKYTGQLAAADVFTFDNAYALLESLRIDAGVLGPFGIHP